MATALLRTDPLFRRRGEVTSKLSLRRIIATSSEKPQAKPHNIAGLLYADSISISRLRCSDASAVQHWPPFNTSSPKSSVRKMLPSPPSCVISRRVFFLLQAARRGSISRLVHVPIKKPRRFSSSRHLDGTHHLHCTTDIMSQPDIPKEQWAQVIEKDGVMTFKKIPVPTPGHDEVLVNIKYSGVCHTDLHALNGDWPLPRKTPVVGGHEGAGVVVKKGDLVTNVNIGDKVGVKWLMATCFHCTFCQQAQESLCPKAQLAGYTKDGTFQQYCVANAAHLARFPPQTDLAAVAPIMCAGLTVYKGLKESETRPGQYVAIVGAGGGLGTIGLQYAHAMGLNVIAIDGGKEKGEACKKLGAAAYIDFKESKDLVAEVKKATPDGLGPHGVVLLAPQEQPFQQATGYVRSHGTVVCIGMPAGAKVSMPVFDTVVRMIKVKGSYVGNREDTAEAVDFFLRGMIHAPYKVVGLSEIQSIFDAMRENRVIGRYVMDMSK